LLVTRESEIGHGLLTLSRPPSKGKAHQTHDNVHVLCIDIAALSEAAKAFMRLSLDEQLGWMAAAAEQGRSLVVLCTRSTIELYTTDHDRWIALRPVLQSMADRVRVMPSLGQTRTVQLAGPSAARQLFGYAAMIDGMAPTIHRASAISAANTALGPTLASLFRTAANVARRVRQETSLQTRELSESVREMEQLSAQRIVEEELATWQAQEAEIERVASELPEAAAPIHSFTHQEPASEVRLRIGTSIKPRISYVLEPKRASR
jgi:hypothetical protein